MNLKVPPEGAVQQLHARYTSAMATVPIAAPPGFDELPVEEKLDYLQTLWARIVSKPEDVPVPDWHRQIITERLAAYRAGKGSSRPWNEFREEMWSLLRPSSR